MVREGIERRLAAILPLQLGDVAHRAGDWWFLLRQVWVMNRPSAPSKIPSVFRPKRDIRYPVSAIRS